MKISVDLKTPVARSADEALSQELTAVCFLQIYSVSANAKLALAQFW